MGYFRQIQSCYLKRGTYDEIVTGCFGSIFEVQSDQVFSQSSIAHLIDLVQHEVEQVESRDQSWGKIDIGGNREFGVVSGIDGIGSCQDGCTCV